MDGNVFSGHMWQPPIIVPRHDILPIGIVALCLPQGR